MAKFRKKPIAVEAVRFDPACAHKYVLPEGVIGYPSYGVDNWNYSGCRFIIETLEGKMEVTPGDWVITGVKGERYPCKPDIFDMTYEPMRPWDDISD